MASALPPEPSDVHPPLFFPAKVKAVLWNFLKLHFNRHSPFDPDLPSLANDQLLSLSGYPSRAKETFFEGAGE